MTLPPSYAPPPPAPPPTIIIIQQPVPQAALPAVTPAGPTAAAPVPRPARNANALEPPSADPSEVYLWIAQDEAAVFLDDDYLGTGEQVAALDAPLEMAPGVHVLAVRHPDYGAEHLVFAAPAAEGILIEINLMGDRSGRKARLRTAWELESRLRLLRR